MERRRRDLAGEPGDFRDKASISSSILPSMLMAAGAAPMPSAGSRRRSAVGSRLVEIGGYSFPSGHAIVATAMYLTLGAVIAMSLESRSLRRCVLLLAAVLALLVDTTRVYIGVHYPTDVLGGWLVGGAWAVLCGTVARSLHDRARRSAPT